MPDNEDSAATAEARRAAKAAQKQANKDAWKTHPANANAAWMQKQAELAGAAPIAVDLPPVAETGSLPRLRAIMADQDQPLHRRLDAAEVILQYELAPAALANAQADTIAVASLQFMRAVADAQDAPDALRFRALRSIAAIENARASRVDPNERETVRRRDIARISAYRRLHLIKLGLWPPKDTAWAIRSEDKVTPSLEDQPEPLSVRIISRYDPWDDLIRSKDL